MAIVIETGHAKNIANFQRLITFATAHGTVYAPSYDAIKLTALNTLFSDAQNAMDEVNVAKPANDHATAARELEFAKLSPLITRVINTLDASGVSAKTVSQARTLVRKLSGQRADNTPVQTIVLADGTTEDAKRQISVSQMSYDNRLENFSKLISFLSTIVEYNPNETNLKITGLTTYHDLLQTKNNEVLNTLVPLSNARINRNRILYKETTGLTSVALDTKKYIKALFGATSSEYKQISKLSFRASK